MWRVIRTAGLATAAALAVGGCGRKPGLEAGAKGPGAESAVGDEARRRAEVSRRVRATLDEHVLFGFDQSDLRLEARRNLDAKAAILRSDAGIRLTVDGHADERGPESYNKGLGMRRANAVKRYLIRAGVDAARIQPRSFGESRPLDPRPNEEAWARNRRVEFVIVDSGQTARER